MSTQTYQTLLKNGTAVLPSGIHKTDIAINDGKIEAIGNLPENCAHRVIDCENLHILPGVIDTQAHFREPGGEHKETLEAGTRAAIAGGVTTIFEMPNTNPLTTTPEAVADKMERAKKSAWCNYAFYLGGTAENAQNLPQWENLPGICGIKIFMGSSTGNLLSDKDEDIEAILSNGKRIVAVHAEDEEMMNHNKETILGESNDVSMHCKWRSVESCLSATKRVLKIARKTGRKVHILHITTDIELEILKKNKDIASVEVLPNHLTLHAPDCYKELGTYAQQNPPIRELKHQNALWKAISDGTIDIIGSDHAPHTIEEKSKQYPQSPSGTPGVQTLVPIMLNHVNEGRLTLQRFVDLVCYGPHRIHQIATKGRIAVGFDADFTIVDMKAEREISNESQQSKSGWTPFNGKKVKGWPIMTIIMGKTVMSDDEIIGEPSGTPVKFRDNLSKNYYK